MNEASGPERKSTAAATSSGRPIRWRVEPLICSAITGRNSVALRVMSVSMNPGDIDTMRAPFWPNARAWRRHSIRTPLLAAAYAERGSGSSTNGLIRSMKFAASGSSRIASKASGTGLWPAIEAAQTSAVSDPAAAKTSRATYAVPRRSTRTTDSQSPLCDEMPARCANPPIGPVDDARATRFRTDAGSATSQNWVATRAPSRRSWSASSASGSSKRSASNSGPRLASRRAVAAPIPPAAPVMTLTMDIAPSVVLDTHSSPQT